MEPAFFPHENCYLLQLPLRPRQFIVPGQSHERRCKLQRSLAAALRDARQRFACLPPDFVSLHPGLLSLFPSGKEAVVTPRVCWMEPSQATRSFHAIALFIVGTFTSGFLLAAIFFILSPSARLAAQQPAAVPVSSGGVAGTPEQSQSSSGTALPSVPAPQSASEGEPAQQTDRILGVIPNFRAISTNQKLPAQSVKEKFVTATEDSFDYSSIFIPAMLAFYSEGTNSTPEFGKGAVGYGRYFWHAAVDQTSENYMVEFVVPAITREDTRYYTLGHGGFIKRTGYALSRAVVTRSDSGKDVFNLSEVVGAGASAGLSTLYYPSRERSLGNTGTEWGLDVAIDAASFVAKEFWPDINHRLFHGAKPTARAAQ